MPISKPSSLPRWATDAGAVVTEPSTTERDSGFVPSTPALAGHTNWLLNNLYQWMQYLNDPQAMAIADLAVAGSLTVGGVNVATATQVPASGSVPSSWGLLALLSDLLAPAVSMQIYTTTGAQTWTKPEGLVAALVICTGGGGGAGGVNSSGDSSNVMIGGGGGSGATTIGLYQAANLGATETVTVGTAGTTGSSSGGNGGTGGASSFTTQSGTLQANGGSGGSGGATTSSFFGGSGAGGQHSGPAPRIGITGSVGLRGSWGTVTITSPTATSVVGGSGGPSFWGGGGQGAMRTSAGANAGAAGVAPGSGGGGPVILNNNIGAVGGAGAAGIVAVIEFKNA